MNSDQSYVIGGCSTDWANPPRRGNHVPTSTICVQTHMSDTFAILSFVPASIHKHPTDFVCWHAVIQDVMQDALCLWSTFFTLLRIYYIYQLVGIDHLLLNKNKPNSFKLLGPKRQFVCLFISYTCNFSCVFLANSLRKKL